MFFSIHLLVSFDSALSRLIFIFKHHINYGKQLIFNPKYKNFKPSISRGSHLSKRINWPPLMRLTRENG